VIVDHGLQAVSAEVAARTAEVLRGLGLDPVEVVRVDVGAAGGPEAAARDARYDALRATATKLGARFVLLGHTLDDQAETVLLGLARGSGARSLSGMSVLTPMGKTLDTSAFLRPLLGITRETTVAFCSDSALEPWHDPHNQDSKFTRVRVRNNVMPMLETELGPNISGALARTADLLRADLRLVGDLNDEPAHLHRRVVHVAVVDALGAHVLGNHARIGDEARNANAHVVIDLENLLLV
jgi:tRNA(Ile)-lysidine synthase